MNGLVFIEERPVAGREHLVQPGTTIGRADCDILLPDPDVSRKHAVFRQIDDGLGIEDLGSTNGTFVNDKRISGITELRAGATVRFGNTVWHLQTTAGATRIASGEEASALMGGTHVASEAEAAEPQPAAAPPAPPPPEPTAAAPPAPAPPAPAPAPPASAAPAPPAPASQVPAAAVAPPPPPPPVQAAQQSPAAPDGRRGDVPPPDFVPSQIRRVIPPPGQVAPFSVPDRGAVRRSAARRLDATLVSFAVVAATAIAVVAFFAER